MPTPVHSPRPVSQEAQDIPDFARVGLQDKLQYLIDGVVRDWNGSSEEILSPIHLKTDGGSTPVRLGRCPLMGESESLLALEAAEKAYDRGCGEWPTMSVADRIRHLESFIPRMEACRADVVRLLMWEIGKSRLDSQKEFDRTLEYMRDTIGALKDLDRTSSRFAIDEGFVAMIRRSPLGVALCMGPYNYPLNETFSLLIPALLMGNTVIFKPPKYGVLIYGPLLRAFADSFPPGVVNVVYGAGPVIISPLMRSGRIDILAFVGSAKVGSLLKHEHPMPSRLRSVMGLGAKNAAVILPDADLDLAVDECLLGAFSFNGQRCTAIKIIFVHRLSAELFCRKFSEAVERLVVGMPWEEGVQITPLPEQGKPEWLRTLVDESIQAGARVLNRGGGTIDHSIFYPAVLYPARANMKVSQAEQFGPVVPIIPYEGEQEVLDWMTRSPMGQQAALFGEDPKRLSRLIDPLVNQVCRVNLNSQCQRGPDKFPFGGRKDSAEGTLSVSDALRVFSIRSLVAAKSTERNEKLISSIVAGRHSNFLSTDFIF